MNVFGTWHRIEKYPFLSIRVSDSKDAQNATNFVYIYLELVLEWKAKTKSLMKCYNKRVSTVKNRGPNRYTYMCIIFLEEIEQFFLCHDEIEREQKLLFTMWDLLLQWFGNSCVRNWHALAVRKWAHNQRPGQDKTLQCLRKQMNEILPFNIVYCVLCSELCFHNIELIRYRTD